MSINSIDIQNDRENLVVHLDDEDMLFFEIPREDDGSENWTRVQDWLDAGNEISDRLAYDKLYAHQRKAEYPDIKEQLDMQYHDAVDGTTTWKDAIQAIKDAHPKP